MSENEIKIEGRYLRIIGTDEIVAWKNFSEMTQLYEVESAAGKVFTVQSNKASHLVTPEQAEEFMRLHNERSN
jgi:hypothetical protein